MKYCEISDIENYLLKEIDSTFETQVEQWIDGVSKMIDNLANRKLVCDVMGSGDEYEVRYYDGNGTNKILIDNCYSVQEIQVGDQYSDDMTVLESSDYLLTPKTAPHKVLIRKNNIIPKGDQNVSVKGNFGLFQEIPADLRLATAIIVAGVISFSTPSNRDKSSESIGNYSVSYENQGGFSDLQTARNIILSYKKYDF